MSVGSAMAEIARTPPSDFDDVQETDLGGGALSRVPAVMGSLCFSSSKLRHAVERLVEQRVEQGHGRTVTDPDALRSISSIAHRTEAR